MKLTNLLIIGLTTLLSSLAHADFELGFKYYQNKEFNKAYKEFSYAASIGDKDAQRNIGIMYFRGEGVTKSAPLSYAWLKLANTPETPENSKTLKLIAKKISAEDIAIGEQEFLKLKPLSNEVVNEKLSPIATENSLSSDPKILKTSRIVYPKQAAYMGDIGLLEISLTVSKDGSARDFLVLNKEPLFVNASIDALRKFQFQPAQANGQTINYFNHKFRFKYSLTRAEIATDTIKRNLARQREKASTGDADSMLIYGLQNDMYKNYLTGTEDKAAKNIAFENPNPWFYKSALQGNANAAFILGSNQIAGQQCQQNIGAGAAWIERAASKGSIDAQFFLGAYYFEGSLFPKDEEKGIFWLEKAAKAGYSNAAVRLARIYASSPNEHWFKPQEAQLIFNTVKDSHLDQLSYFEVKAAVAAANGDFKTALKAQKTAIELAQDYELNLPVQQQALAKYQQNLPWREL